MMQNKCMQFVNSSSIKEFENAIDRLCEQVAVVLDNVDISRLQS